MVSLFEKEIADKTASKSNGFVRNARTPKREHLPQLQHYDYVPKEVLLTCRDPRFCVVKMDLTEDYSSSTTQQLMYRQFDQPRMEIQVSDVAIYKWICKYSTMVSKYLNEIVPRTGNWVRADEVWIKIAGEQKYLFASMDDDTRYWLASDIADTKFQHNADHLLELTKKAIGKNPTQFITDGLPAYKKSSKKVFGKNTVHTRHIHIQKDMNNNKMERLNGEIRDREKVFRGLKKMDTPILDGMKVYYNFTKKHGALKGKTPSESSTIIILVMYQVYISEFRSMSV